MTGPTLRRMFCRFLDGSQWKGFHFFHLNPPMNLQKNVATSHAPRVASRNCGFFLLRERPASTGALWEFHRIPSRVGPCPDPSRMSAPWPVTATKILLRSKNMEAKNTVWDIFQCSNMEKLPLHTRFHWSLCKKGNWKQHFNHSSMDCQNTLFSNAAHGPKLWIDNKYQQMESNSPHW